MEGLAASDWFLLFATPIVCGLFLWRVFANRSPKKAIERTLKKIAKDYKDQLFYALPCETYQNGRPQLGVLAVLDARIHFESVLGDHGFDVAYPRIRAYLFQDKTSRGESASNMRVLLVSTDQGALDFGVPSWGEPNLTRALQAAFGKQPLPSPKTA